MVRMVTEAVTEGSNQYPPLMGLPELRQAVARHSEKFNQLPVDWQAEVLITVGATEGIASAFLGILNQGDEVRCKAYSHVPIQLPSFSEHIGLRSGFLCFNHTMPHSLCLMTYLLCRAVPCWAVLRKSVPAGPDFEELDEEQRSRHLRPPYSLSHHLANRLGSEGISADQ